MVARINTGKSISKALNYNEQKVRQGSAEILLATGFIKDTENLTFYDKLSQFERHTSLNERARTNTLHISLNFDPSEKLSNEKLIAIAEDYMQRIGFGHQPYLVYRHYDAGHPHIHIVSTNIERDGKRISTHRLGANQSEKARKEIETQFSLVKAGHKEACAVSSIKPVNAEKITYGKSETKRAIANVLMVVLNQYKYTSMAELNAILKLYNAMADGGSENSRMHKKKGLVYRVLDSYGNKIGAPIKASAFYMKPTLSYLEKKFVINEALRAPYKVNLQSSINWVFNKNPKSLEHFIKLLEKENISTVLRIGKQDNLYGITYIDHRSKCIFNGSDLGKAFSANAIVEKFKPSRITIPLLKNKEYPLKHQVGHPNVSKGNENEQKFLEFPAQGKEAFDPAYVPLHFKKKKRKKRKRQSL